MRLTGGLHLLPRPTRHRENGLRTVSLEATIAAIETFLAASSMEVVYEQLIKAGSSLRSSVIHLISSEGPGQDGHFYGKGVTGRQAFASAFMELTERFCARRLSGDLVVRASYQDVREMAIDPQLCILPRSSVYAPDLVIEWVSGYSLTRAADVLVPANLVYLPYEAHDPARAICGADSNGLASGNCIEEAALHGLLELIERDTAFVVEYNRLDLPDLVLDAVSDDGARSLVLDINRAGLKCHLKDARLDLGIPAVSAFLEGESPAGTSFSQAWAAHLSPVIALSRALTEALQLYPRCKNFESWISSGPLDYYREKGGEATAFSEIPDLSDADITACLYQCVELLGSKGIEIVLVDLGLREVPFSVARVIALGLQPYTTRARPRLSARLLTVPVRMGHRPVEGDYGQLSPRAVCGFGE